ncbi:MAG: serine/threonine protein kinase [Myxococcales bacterium]|nr:serine/threonine protein kinase [Myxococcales bacterium]
MTEVHQPQQRYRVLERLASGGMAEVFIAESAGIEGFKKRVAIKRVLPHLSEKKRFISMFLDEARLSAQLSHSNCVQVFDIGVGDNAYFIVMEYVDGSDLKAVIDYLKSNNRVFPVEAATLIAIRICEGLTYAHELQGGDGKDLHIVHRDMSPPNVLITKHGEVKIVDFGLAKATSQLEKSEPGIIKGKFSYLAPEAALGGDVDLRADIFAVGIILWELLSGKRLFLADTDFGTVKMVQQAQVPALRSMRPDVPEELDRILARALAKDPNARYRSARDLGRDLTACLYRQGKPVSSFDIAELVRGAMALRKKKAPDKTSVIDKLIEEALFEFTSLQEGEEDGGGKKGADAKEEPLKLGFEDIGKWADELSVGHQKKSEAESQIRASIYAAEREIGLGNLAALEDDEPPRSGGGGGAGLAPPAIAPAPLAANLPAPSSGRSMEPARKGTSPVLYVVLVLVLAGGIAGAWFGGLIPH